MKIPETTKQHETNKPTENFSPNLQSVLAKPRKPQAKNHTRKGRKRLQAHQIHSLSQGRNMPSCSSEVFACTTTLPPLSRLVQLKRIHTGITRSSPGKEEHTHPQHSIPGVRGSNGTSVPYSCAMNLNKTKTSSDCF